MRGFVVPTDAPGFAGPGDQGQVVAARLGHTAFGHPAVLAGRPGNRAPLEEAGGLFGRLAHLLDAVEDLAEDAETGAWNPIAAAGADLAEVRRLCDDAVHGVRLALKDTAFASKGSGRLADVLLAHELERAGSTAPSAPPAGPTPAMAPAPRSPPTGCCSRRGSPRGRRRPAGAAGRRRLLRAVRRGLGLCCTAPGVLPGSVPRPVERAAARGPAP
ncbi:hypothetical protein SANTM175S_06808 [Streptomyces antimycoticus]